MAHQQRTHQTQKSTEIKDSDFRNKGLLQDKKRKSLDDDMNYKSGSNGTHRKASKKH